MRRQTLLLHPEPDGIDWVGRRYRVALILVGFDQRHEDFHLVGLRRAGFSLIDALETAQRSVQIGPCASEYSDRCQNFFSVLFAMIRMPSTFSPNGRRASNACGAGPGLSGVRLRSSRPPGVLGARAVPMVRDRTPARKQLGMLVSILRRQLSE